MYFELSSDIDTVLLDLKYYTAYTVNQILPYCIADTMGSRHISKYETIGCVVYLSAQERVMKDSAESIFALVQFILRHRYR